VIPESLAAAAGITGGDRLLTIDSTDISGQSLARILALLSSEKPGSVTLKLWRKGGTYEVVLERQQLSKVLARQGMKIVAQGLIVPSDSTEIDIERLSQIMSGEARLVAHPFPAHVPLNNDLFHGGFALLILRNPDQVVATGVENGPASRAGVRQGDIILSINEVDLRNKTAAQIETLFSGDGPELVRLKIDRGGTIKTVEYRMERVSAILKFKSVASSRRTGCSLRARRRRHPLLYGKEIAVLVQRSPLLIAPRA
jgi:C-terminal processing protease CtpA/Prc